MKAVFEGLASDGDAYARYFWTNSRGKRESGLIAVTFDSVLLRSDLQQPAEKPKYDPCRLFKNGDEVCLREHNGRNPYDFLNKCTIERYGLSLFRVLNDELESGDVDIKCEFGGEQVMRIHCSHIELVTPVEELEPYFVAYDDKFYHVHKKGEDAALAVYYETKHPHAKEAAEAECARLNAKYRKEQA